MNSVNEYVMTIKKKWSGLSASSSVYIPKNRDIAKNHEYIVGTCQKRRSMRDYELVGTVQKHLSTNFILGGRDYIFQSTKGGGGNFKSSEVWSMDVIL